VKVTVQYFASLREMVEQREEIVTLNKDTTVLGLLQLLASRHGNDFESYVFERNTETPKAHLQFLLDGQSISRLEGLQTVIQDNSRFAIIPPVGGG
jgi:MoaD family protein